MTLSYTAFDATAVMANDKIITLITLYLIHENGDTTFVLTINTGIRKAWGTIKITIQQQSNKLIKLILN